MSSMVRIAVIGAGKMANLVHYPSLASFEDVQIAAISDLDEQRLAETADRYGVSGRFRDYRQMVKEVSPDGVYAIGPPSFMFPVWIWCLQEGLNLYIEKPMGLTRHESQMLADLAERKGAITQVSHQRRSSPLLRRVHRECLARGPITHAVCEFYKCAQQPLYASMDRMMADTTHSIDTVRWMCGGQVTGVHSRCRRVGTPDINWIGATLEFDNGATGYVINSWSSGRRVFRVEMHAPGIYADAEVEGKALVYADGDHDGVAYDARDLAGGSELYQFAGFRDKHREFIDSLKGGREVTSSPFRDCVKTMEVAHQILAHATLQRQ